MTDASVAFDVVIPTIGRPSLDRLLVSLAATTGPRPRRVLLADDRGRADRPLPRGVDLPLEVVAAGGRGPAAARNAGAAHGDADWIVFLDDDVVVGAQWAEDLAADLAAAPADVVAVQARIDVPLPSGRRPTDWERNVARLSEGRWITADLAVRRAAFAAAGGFDERFPRAYREDADLAIALARHGRLVVGRRVTTHPVPPADAWVSVRKQAGNADDALMRRRHGPRWREVIAAGPSTFRAHVATTAVLALAVGGAITGRRRVAAAAFGAWAGAWASFTAKRLRDGPRDAREIATMAATSAAIPVAAVVHRLRGEWNVARAARRGLPPYARVNRAAAPRAVLFDRDGTLVVDVPYNGDPGAVVPVPGAADALGRLRDAGFRLAVVSNQSGIARGVLTEHAVRAVNRRVEELLGPLGPVFVCPHGPDDGCSCRKPAPGLVVRAAAALGVAPRDCVLIGDTEADVHAALAAGAHAILVPNGATRGDEVARAPLVAPDIARAVDLVLASSVGTAR